MVRKRDEVKYFFAVIYTANPPFSFQCPVCDPLVAKGDVEVTNYKWTAPNLSDPSKKDAYDIGDHRQVGNYHREPVVVGIFDRRKKAHRDLAKSLVSELSGSNIKRYGT